MNKRKFTDTPVTNALTPSTRESSEHPRGKLCLNNKKEKRATYLKRDAQKQKAKIKKNKKKSKTAGDTNEEDSEDTSCVCCLGASREMRIHCADCKLRSHEECTDSSPNCICLICHYDGNGTLHFE
jgi:hypothetical protein